jgi:hypothetical protein
MLAVLAAAVVAVRPPVAAAAQAGLAVRAREALVLPDLADLALKAQLLDLADVVLVAAVPLQRLLSRQSFSAAMARTTPCPAPAPTYERVPRSR